MATRQHKLPAEQRRERLTHADPHVLAGGAVTGNAEDVLAQAAGVGVATGSTGGTLRTRAGGGSGAPLAVTGAVTP